MLLSIISYFCKKVGIKSSLNEIHYSQCLHLIKSLLVHLNLFKMQFHIAMYPIFYIFKNSSKFVNIYYPPLYYKLRRGTTKLSKHEKQNLFHCLIQKSLEYLHFLLISPRTVENRLTLGYLDFLVILSTRL